MERHRRCIIVSLRTGYLKDPQAVLMGSNTGTVDTNVTISLRLKMGPVLATEGELPQTATTPRADSVLRLMVRGREHSTTGSGRTMVRSGRGPVSYPTGQPSGS